MSVTFVEEYRTVDKTEWGPGDWQDEPDKVVWVDEATSLDCMAVRHPSSGHWCGYVGVPEGHPAHGKGYDDIDVSVHGGLTFAEQCRPDEKGPEYGICHIEQPGRPDHIFWLGFDCAHAGDLSPAYQRRYREAGIGTMPFGYETYKPLTYVVSEVESLAVQLAGTVTA